MNKSDAAPIHQSPSDGTVVVDGPALGLVHESNEAYHAGPGISKSHLDAINARSPRHYWQRYVNPDREPEEMTDALIVGTAVHTAILEPDLFPSQVVESPGFDRRTKAGKSEWEHFSQLHAGKIILKPDDYEHCLRMRDAVHNHPVASGLLHGGHSELSFYAIDEETGELIKCRTDYLRGDLIVDVKTTDDASPAGFGKSAANYRYPVQTAWYHHVLDSAYGEHPRHWVFLAIEKEPPYAIGLYWVEPEDLERARIAARRDFLRIVEHRRSGVWPDYAMDPRPLSMPVWAKL